MPLRPLRHYVVGLLSFVVRRSFLRDFGRSAYRSLRRLWFANHTLDRGAVVFAGDSLIDQWATLAEDFPDIEVANRGISGDISRELLRRFSMDVLACHPCAIVILVGTNDLADGVLPSDVAENLRQMITLAATYEAGIPTIVCQLLPRDGVRDHLTQNVYELNSLIDRLPITHPTASVCRTFASTATAEGMPLKDYFVDGLHLSASGYRALTVALTQHLKPYCRRSK